MPDTATPPRLPRGRHGIPREEVEQAQRIRILVGMAEAVGANGFANTPVAEVLKHAGVSRETFYQLYSSKQECFLATLDFVGAALFAQLGAAIEGPGEPLERFERTLSVYLETIVALPSYARLFLVEVHAAGPEAMARRAELQARLADALAALLGAGDEADRFACQVLVAAISAMVSSPLVAGDDTALRALGPPILDHVRRLLDAGTLFGPQAHSAP